MNKLVVLSFAVVGMCRGVLSYDAIQSPLFERFHKWVDEYKIEVHDNEHFRKIFIKWEDNHNYIEKINAQNSVNILVILMKMECSVVNLILIKLKRHLIQQNACIVV